MSYAIGILRQAYDPDLQGIERVRFIMDDGDQDVTLYDTAQDAQDAIDELDDSGYVTSHGESGRPECIIVDDGIADWIISGRDGDMSNYNWDHDCTRGTDDTCCGECQSCIDYMIAADRNYIRHNAVTI